MLVSRLPLKYTCCLQTIGAAFAKARSASKSLPLEVVQSAAKIVDSYNAQNIRNALEHHRHEVVNKRRYVADATPDKIAQVRKYS